MDQGTIFGRGISFPPRLGPDGRLAFSEGPQNIREAIQVILLTVPGERLMLTGFGGKLRQFLYEPNTVATRRQSTRLRMRTVWIRSAFRCSWEGRGKSMPLNVPQLDDRTFLEFLSEAQARIPVHNPEWTNFNDSDPGITVLQLFAFMAESTAARTSRG